MHVALHILLQGCEMGTLEEDSHLTLLIKAGV